MSEEEIEETSEELVEDEEEALPFAKAEVVQ